MQLSIIISTYNRCDSLSRTLQSVGRLNHGCQWELVIVNNRSSDATESVIKEFVQCSSLDVKSIFEPKAGLANARNAGLRAAAGEIVAFTDDDCLPEIDFIANWLEVFSEDPTIGFAGGRILLHDPSDLPFTIQESTTRVEIQPGEYIPSGLIQGANFAFRRTALVAAEGFDPFFGAGAYYAAEDLDSVARVSSMGWRGVYDPRPIVRHDHGRKELIEVTALENTYARGRGACYVKCILRNQWSRQAWKQWYWALCRKSKSCIGKEFLGGISFLCRHTFNFGRRFRDLRLQEGDCS